MGSIVIVKVLNGYESAVKPQENIDDRTEETIEHLSGSLSAPDYYKRSENKRRGVKIRIRP